MNDLLLYALLTEEHWSDARLEDLLRELAASPLRDRIPFFGGLLRLATYDSRPVELRRLALQGLEGATGRVAVEAFVACLEEPQLVDSAVSALARVACVEPSRWAHVVFHPEACVRRAGWTASRGAAATRRFDLHLASDAALADEVLAEARAGTLAPSNIDHFVDAIRHGVLPQEVAFDMVLQHRILRAPAGVARAAAPIKRFLESVEAGPEASRLAGTADDIDVLLGVVPDEVPGGMERVVGIRPNVASRFAASAWLDILARGATPSRLELLALCHPRSLLSPALSPADVRTAAAVFLRHGVGVVGADAEALVRGRAMSRKDGAVDLFLVAAFLRLVPKDPYAVAHDVVGEHRLAKALRSAPMDDVVAMLSLRDKDAVARGRHWLLGLLPTDGPGRTQRDALEAFAETAPLAMVPFIASLLDRRDVIVPLHTRDRIEMDRAAALAQALVRVDGFAPLGQCLACSGSSRLAMALLDETANALEADDFAERAGSLSPSELDALLSLTIVVPLPLGKEIALAHRLYGHAHGPAAAWAKQHLPAIAQRTPVPQRARQGVAYRPPPSEPDLPTTIALLGSMDPEAATDAAFASCFSDDEAFVERVEQAMVDTYATSTEPLSPLGHAWLWRWERHCMAHLERGLESHPTLAALILARVELSSVALRTRAMAAIASAIAMLAARQPDRFEAMVGTVELDALVAALPDEAGSFAARALRSVHLAGRHELHGVIASVRLLMPDLDDEVRRILSPLVDARGLAPKRRARVVFAPDALLERVRRERDLDALLRLTEHDSPAVVHEATLRLIELGETGCAQLADRIGHSASPEALRPIVESIALWPVGSARDRALSFAHDASRASELRFRLSMAGCECRIPGSFAQALACLLEPEPESLFCEVEDWHRLLAACQPTDGDRELTLALQLAESPHPHVYIRSVERLIASAEDMACQAAIRRFLQKGARRMGSLRRRAAMTLHALGDDTGFHLVVGQCLDAASGRPHLFDRATPARIESTALAFLAAGVAHAKEAALVHQLAAVPTTLAERALDTVMQHAVTDKARMDCARLLSTRAGRERKLQRLAEVFAWGATIAKRLLGKPMRIRMTGTLRLGFTRTQQNAIFVTPLPLLRGDRHGREIVEGLILHELGHHLYHAGKEGERVWKRAETEGLHGLFNLVADEHLERNLRALDTAWGNRLKRLAAYAFQHTSRSVAVDALLDHLGARAFDVLTGIRLGVDRDPKEVRVESGALLFSMERASMSFGRFVRSLRMGLGNRHDDPKVAEALALFTASFKKSSMEELYGIMQELVRIFGFEVRMADTIGGHEELAEGGVEDLVWSDGITQDELDRMIERVSRTGDGPPRGSSGPMPAGKLFLNTTKETAFDPIDRVEPVGFDAVAYAPYRKKVQRPAALLRGFLEDLGLCWVERRRLVAGKSLDRARILPLAVRRDPRAMRSRQQQPNRDLFLGLAIDCSGSMVSRDNIERAKAFGALIVEAARPLDQVDVRVLGFNDSKLFDCGPKTRCAVHGLRAAGGNNDAAALSHLGGEAKASRRRAKVLVMISDGLPTQCSVDALRHVVSHLSRREGMVVAQVAVQPLAEKCFPHYVVLTEGTIEASVRRFGTIVADLVRRALGAG